VSESDLIAKAQAELERNRAKAVAAAREKGLGAPPMVGAAVSGALAALPDHAEIAGYGRLLQQLTSKDPEARRRARFAVADDVRRNLHRFKKRPIPSFPVRLPPESVLMGILAKRGKQRGPSDKATVWLFVKWREAVYRAEHANEGTLRALFEAVATLREFELPDYTIEILEHLEVEFEVEDVPAERMAWPIELITRDYSILSRDLRSGERTKKRKAVTHPEDDDTALRRDAVIPLPGSSPDPDDGFDVPDFP
jgi:hypothetical protein